MYLMESVHNNDIIIIIWDIVCRIKRMRKREREIITRINTYIVTREKFLCFFYKQNMIRFSTKIFRSKSFTDKEKQQNDKAKG